MNFADWPQAPVNPLTIQLDDENPRIAGSGLTQAEIRELLLEHEDVAKLSHSIVKNEGLYPHDLVIICSINGNKIVLEGNRRVAALQMLLNPNLIPDAYKDKMPRAEKPLQDRLRSIQAVTAPDRPSADHLIAQIHAFSARKGWSAIAKYRYAFSRYLEKQDVSQIALDLGSEVSEVRKFIRRYNIFKEIFAFKWTPEEDQVLRGEQLQITPFIYPFERSNIKELIGDVFDSEGRRNPKYITSIVDYIPPEARSRCLDTPQLYRETLAFYAGHVDRQHRGIFPR
jgi:hypothetical protein